MLARIACLFSATILLLAADDPADARMRKELGPLQGKWKLVSLEAKGETMDLGDRRPKWIIKGTKVLYGGEELARLVVDSTATPKIIDLSLPNPKKVYEGVYSIDQDILKICLSKQTEGVRERPQDFSTKDKENLRLLVFQRYKAEEEDELEGQRGYVGVALRLDPKQNEVVVGEVLDDSPAKKAGLQKDDVILKIAGARPTSLSSAVDTVRGTKPGTQLTVHVRRAGKETDILVKVAIMPFILLAGLD